MTTHPEHPLIEVKDLSVRYGRGTAPVLRDVSFSMDRGESVALVGDSGCGKSTLALAMMQLLPSDAQVRGSIVLREEALSAPIDILGADEGTMQAIRGSRLAMMFQNPVGSLDPVMRIGNQLSEVIQLARTDSRKVARQEAVNLLKHVGVADPTRLARAWTHELSGGMAQRVALAMALAGGPTLLIADEPTSALDGNVQAQIVELIRVTRRQNGLSVLLITHDMAIARALADRVCVMDGNRIVEDLPAAGLNSSYLHAATRRLVEAAKFKHQNAVAGVEGEP